MGRKCKATVFFKKLYTLLVIEIKLFLEGFVPSIGEKVRCRCGSSLVHGSVYTGNSSNQIS